MLTEKHASTRKETQNTPVSSFAKYAYHSSPPCTGTCIVNRNVNSSRLSSQRLQYHRQCRRCVSDSRKAIQSFRRGGFTKSKFVRSSSGEQPRFASFPRRGTWVCGAPRLVSRKAMVCTVHGCVVGLRLSPTHGGKALPICKAWVFQTDHPGLAGVLSQFSCPGNHEACATFVESSQQDVASLSATACYPRALAYFFVLALSLRWHKGRQQAI